MGRFFGNGDGHKAGGTHPRMGKQSRPQKNIQSWDKSFLAGRARDFQNSHSNGKTTAAVSEYFPLHKVVRGAGELLESFRDLVRANGRACQRKVVPRSAKGAGLSH